MAATFPQLFKRSAFAAHDSLITRVYSATPQSAAIGDWGLKSPVNRAKGSRYIKISELDSAMGIGAMWSSGENEARFMSMWGDGSVPWDAKAKRPVRASMRNDLGFAEDVPEPQTVGELLPDVESMTEAQFARYLQYIRKNRGQLRDKLHAEDGRAHLSPPEEATLTHAAVRGATRDTDSADFQVELTTNEFTSPESTRLKSRPHRLHGLAYSAMTSGAAAAAADPALAHKGRVLDRAPRSYGGTFREGTNSNWVVGLGGLTATAPSGMSRIADKSSLSQFDYKRERPEAGINYFGIKNATIREPPRVLGLFSKTEGGQRYMPAGIRTRAPPVSAAVRPAPLKSFRFNIDVAPVPAPEQRANLGTSEWVAREPSRPAATTVESDLGILGSRRNARGRGDGAAAANRLKMTSISIENLLAKLQTVNKS